MPNLLSSAKSLLLWIPGYVSRWKLASHRDPTSIFTKVQVACFSGGCEHQVLAQKFWGENPTRWAPRIVITPINGLINRFAWGYNPTYRSSFTPFITGFWAHLVVRKSKKNMDTFMRT